MALRPVAITGASGFVGRRLTARLGEGDHPLRLLARDPRRLEDPAAHEVVEGGLDDGAALERLCSGADAVIHCAGAITALSTAGYEAVNVRGTAALAEAAARAGVRRFILVSSLAAREPALSGYGASKRKGEEALAAAKGGLSWVALRPPVVYGPGDKGTLPLIQQLARPRPVIPGSARGRVSLIYVDDLADALAGLVAEGPEGSVHELHDGTPEGYSWADLAEAAGVGRGPHARCIFLPRPLLAGLAPLAVAAGRVAGHVPMLTPGKVRELYHEDWVCRNALLDDETAWRPRIRFAEGFKRTLDWYRRAGWL